MFYLNKKAPLRFKKSWLTKLEVHNSIQKAIIYLNLPFN